MVTGRSVFRVWHLGDDLKELVSQLWCVGHANRTSQNGSSFALT